MTDRFKWDDGSVIVPHRSAIAVYENQSGELVIRQEAGPYDDEDKWICVAPENVSALIAALRKIKASLGKSQKESPQEDHGGF